MINIKDFGKLDLRIGTIQKVELLKNAKQSSYILEIELGNIGLKKSSAQITELYKPEDLIGKQIMAIVNLPPKKIAAINSEVLVLGANDENGAVVLLEPGKPIPAGAKIS